MPELFKGAMRKDKTLNMYLYLLDCKLLPEVYKYRPARTTTRAGKHYEKRELLLYGIVGEGEIMKFTIPDLHHQYIEATNKIRLIFRRRCYWTTELMNDITISLLTAVIE